MVAHLPGTFVLEDLKNNFTCGNKHRLEGDSTYAQPGSPVVNLGVCEGPRPSIPALYPKFPEHS